MIKQIILTSLFTVSATFAFSQSDKKDDESKMMREVINVQVDKVKYAAPAAPAAPAVENTKNGKKKTAEAPPAEPPVDTTGPSMPAPANELVKRAKLWSEDNKSTKYTKSGCGTNGSSTVCQVSFPYKIKELNPTDKVEGEIVMTVTIEAKEGKYRYTVNNIKHKANVSETSGGDVYLPVPECGSMKLSDLSWKHIKSAAFADAKMVVDDLKAKMMLDSGDAPKKDDW